MRVCLCLVPVRRLGWVLRRWSQGPVFLQILALLKGIDGFEAMAPDSPEFIHNIVRERRPFRTTIIRTATIASTSANRCQTDRPRRAAKLELLSHWTHLWSRVAVSCPRHEAARAQVEATKLAFADRTAYYSGAHRGE